MVNGKFDSDHDWCAEDTKAESSEYAPIWAGGKVIALVVDSGKFCGLRGHPIIEANAALIAAAPMMLEALESVWLWMENQADGQSKGGHATFDLMMLREQRDIVRAAIAKATGGAA